MFFSETSHLSEEQNDDVHDWEGKANQRQRVHHCLSVTLAEGTVFIEEAVKLFLQVFLSVPNHFFRTIIMLTALLHLNDSFGCEARLVLKPNNAFGQRVVVVGP